MRRKQVFRNGRSQLRWSSPDSTAYHRERCRQSRGRSAFLAIDGQGPPTPPPTRPLDHETVCRTLELSDAAFDDAAFLADHAAKRQGVHFPCRIGGGPSYAMHVFARRRHCGEGRPSFTGVDSQGGVFLVAREHTRALRARGTAGKRSRPQEACGPAKPPPSPRPRLPGAWGVLCDDFPVNSPPVS